MTSTTFGDANSGFEAGTINGSVNATFAKQSGAVSGNSGVVFGEASGPAHIIGSQTNHHYYQARPATPPKPSCSIPFRRDPHFVDRGTILDQINDKCSEPASRIALVGFGGVGKSQLAIEHCYRTVDQWPETWVFWVHASNAARLEQGYRDIADQVQLADRGNPQANVFQLVCDWLRDEKHGRWLLVIDNADNAAVLSPSSSDGEQHLSRYLPPSKHGSVLVTSRTKHAASRLVEESDIFYIEPMLDTGAQALLHKKLGDRVNKDGIGQLAEALEYMPLALVQAAVYIRKRAPHYSVRQYLEEFRRRDKRKTSLLNQEAGHLRRDEDAKNSIIITWQISFEHIQSIRSSAADLLSFMSFFDRQGIPRALLRDRAAMKIAHKDTGAKEENGYISDDGDSTSEANVYDEFEDDVLTLRDYSFVFETTDVNLLEMHSLVQLATQKWLESKNEVEGWKQQFVSALCAAFPAGDYKNWEKCRQLFPHAKAVLEKRPRDKESCKEWAQLLYNAAWYALSRGNAVEAEEIAKMSLKARTEILGVESYETLQSMTLLGLSINLAGRWREAEVLDMQVMELSKKKLGEDHPDTLVSMTNLAITYRSQGRWKDAEAL